MGFLKKNYSFCLYTVLLFLAISMLPPAAIDPSSRLFLLSIGLLAIWRYTWGLTNFIRSLVYRNIVFPRWRKLANENPDDLKPSEIYILVTAFRIKTEISRTVIHSIIREAQNCGVPVKIIASIVEMQDEFLFKEIFNSYDLPDHIELRLVRIPGSGKRAGLSQGFKAISRCMPADDAVVVVMDGDTILLPDCLKRSVPFFKLRPRLGALTTDELCHLEGTELMKEWHDLRFAQRQVLMSSISLSKRVMTLTGRMSMFRASIVTSRGFIEHVTEDYLDHWRLGRFKFLTGDDKSSLYYVIKEQWEQIYVPDVQVLTMEDPPSRNFFVASTQLMFRWFGNMLRTNERILKLGPHRMPIFVWWAFLDQRLSMWTSLCGPVFAAMLAYRYGVVFFAYYFVWVAFIRWLMTIMLLTARDKVTWRYPLLLYYGQVYGAIIKTWVMFRLDIQSWTRQKTKLNRGLSDFDATWNKWTSHVIHATAILFLICIIGYASSTFVFPTASCETY